MIQTIHDIDNVMKIAGDDSVYNSIIDDGSIKDIFQLAFSMLTTPGSYVLMPDDNSMMVFTRRSHITYDMHIAVINGTSRQEAKRLGVSGVGWILNNTPCKKVIAFIPAFKKKVLLFAGACGLTREGISKDSFQFKNKIYDEIIMGLTKDRYFELYGGV